MTNAVLWGHIGGLHRDEADRFASRPRLEAIAADVNRHGGCPVTTPTMRPPSRIAAITDAHDKLLNDGRMMDGATRSTGQVEDGDAIQMLVRATDMPRRGLTVALGCDSHALGARPAHGIEDKQPGSNKNGIHWC